MMMIAIVCHKYVETPQKSWEHILLRQYHIQSTASMNIIAQMWFYVLRTNYFSLSKTLIAFLMHFCAITPKWK